MARRARRSGVFWQASKPEKPEVKTEKDCVIWQKNDKPHRLDGPAIVFFSGREEWHVFGELHRERGPAVVDDNLLQWWARGVMRREESWRGSLFYDSQKRLHREDGPAVEKRGGLKEYYLHGDLHRKGAPARILPDGREEWWQRGRLHRTGGPARIQINGIEEWVYNGLLHREGGPAFIRPDGNCLYCRHGKIHREDGPAYQGKDDVNYGLNGERYSFTRRDMSRWQKAKKLL